jgi:hypothetical protein
MNTTSPSNYFGTNGPSGPNTNTYAHLGNGGVTNLAGVLATNITYHAWTHDNYQFAGGEKDYFSIGEHSCTALHLIVDNDFFPTNMANEVRSGRIELYKIHPVGTSIPIPRQDGGVMDPGYPTIVGAEVFWSTTLNVASQGVVEFDVQVDSCALITNVGLGFTYRTVP